MVSTLPAAPRTRRVPSNGVLIAVLGALTALAPLTIDMYIPGFPEMARDLATTEAAVQLTMTAFLAGMVVGQLVIGPLSDRLGRRRPLLAGAAAFTVLSALAALAPNVEALIGVRFLQGVAGAAGMVLARAIVTDRFAGPSLGRYFSLLSVILGIAPVVAPVLGAAILSGSSWRGVFWLLAAVGAVLWAAVHFGVRESLPPGRRHIGGIGATLRTMGGLLAHRRFMALVLTVAFSAAALFSYVSGSSFLFQHHFGVSTATYSLIFASNSVAVLVSGALFGVLSARVDPRRLLYAFAAIALVGAAALAALALTGTAALVPVWLSLFVILFGNGGMTPAAMTLAQGLGRETAGAASALVGGIQFLFGAIASPLPGVLGTDSVAPMGAVMLACYALAAASLGVFARRSA